MKKRLFEEEEEEEEEKDEEEQEEDDDEVEEDNEKDDFFDELDVNEKKLDSKKKDEKNKDYIDSKEFISNNCPDELKKRIYTKLQFESASNLVQDNSYFSHALFKSTGWVHIFFIPRFHIFMMMPISILFYYLLITYIIYPETKLLILLIILYIIGIFYQIIVVPEPKKFRPKEEFEDLLNKLLNSSVQIKLYNNGKRKATYQAKYTIDMTNILNIPNDFHYASIKGVGTYLKNDIYPLVNKFNSTYGNKNSSIKREITYKGEKINFDDKVIYSMHSNTDLYSINYLTTIYCLLLLQWIYSLYYALSNIKFCVVIYLTKLITNDSIDSPTEITIRGKRYLIEPFVKNHLGRNDQLDKDYKEHVRLINEQKRKDEERKKWKEKERLENEKKEKEKERKEREIREEKERNTEILSKFKNENYYIEVKRVYDKVFLSFVGYQRKKDYRYKKELGLYDPYCKEKIIEKDQLTIFYPNGFDIRIEILRGLTSYTINIGTEYTKNINYYYD